MRQKNRVMSRAARALVASGIFVGILARNVEAYAKPDERQAHRVARAAGEHHQHGLRVWLKATSADLLSLTRRPALLRAGWSSSL